MIVVDASAALALALGQADETMYVTGELAAPHLLDCEVLNGLRNLLIGGNLTEEQAVAALRVFGDIEIERFAVSTLRPRIWELRYSMTAYDGAYVALAESLDVDHLLTADARLANAPGPRCRVRLLGAPWP